MALTLVVSILMAAQPPKLQSEPVETLIRLNLHPKAASKPALRYLLLPELAELTAGNPIQGYLQCFFDQDLGGEREVLGKDALRQADRAARMEKPDWQIVPRMRKEGIGTLLPDVQKMRALAAALQERFRSEVAQGRIDDALSTAKTMFALARHMGEHPTLIGDLVGFALAQIAIGPLEEMLALPDCPNLYWAITNLPAPFISLERGMEGERLIVQSELKRIDDTVPMTPAQLKKAIDYIDRLRDLEESPKHKRTQAWLDERIKDPRQIQDARQRLVESGIPNERVDRFPPEQVVLLDQKRELEIRRDEVTKLMPLPTWQFQEHFAALNLPTREKDASLFGSSLFPAYQKVRQAQGRVEQRLALLRVVEALRLHAASHEGKLPQKLDDVGVPLPVDPFTGKPFRYSLDGSVGHLRGTPPMGMSSVAAYNIHYEITMAH